MKKMLAVLGVSLLSFVGVAAHADTVTDMGSTYTLSYTNAGSGVYDVTLSINTSGFNGGGSTSSSDFLNAVGLKLVPNASDISSVTVMSAPAGYSSTAQLVGVNSGGCSSTADGFFCLAYTGAGNGVPVGSTYTFQFAVTVPNASNLLTGTDAASIKAIYLSSTGAFVGQTSIPATLTPGTPTPTPEPSSIALLGTALLGAAGVIKRRFV